MGFISHHITSLVIYSLGGGYIINTHTDDPHRINFKKPGMCWPQIEGHLSTSYLPISVSGQLLETFRLLIKSQPMFIAQTSGLHHSIARCLVSLEIEFQFRDTFICKMTAKILEHVIDELSDSETNYWTALLSCVFLRTNYQTGH